MKTAIRHRLVATVAILLLVCSSLSAEAISTIPDTQAGQRVRESLVVIDSGDITRIREYVSTQFTQSFLDMFGEEQLFDVYYGFFEKYKGLELHKVRESTSQKFVGVFRCRRTGSAFLFGLSVISKPPYKIHGMTILPMSHPDQPESLNSLSEEEKVKMLESYLNILAEADVFSGVVLLAKNGRVLFTGAYGYADSHRRVRNQTETRFNLASLNKMFTAVAVAQLCEQGKMSFDDPVGRYLDGDWLSPKISKGIKVKHLLSHTSGIAISKEDDNLMYLEESIGNRYRRIDDYKALMGDAFRRAKPGEKFSYSNIGYHLLAPITETVSGEGYYDYIQTHVFNPAGMSDAGFDELDHLEPNTARGYVKEQEDETVSWRSNQLNCSWKGTPAGGAYSTVEDLLKFERALKENLLVSPETKALLFAPKEKLGARSYGYGFSVRQFDGQLKVGHTGGYVGINNAFSMYLNNDYTVIILCNIDLISGSAVSDIEFYINGLFF